MFFNPIEMTTGFFKKLFLLIFGGLGVSFLTTTVFRTFVETLYEWMQSNFNEMGVLLLQLAGMCGLDLAFNILLSAMIARISISSFMKIAFNSLT